MLKIVKFLICIISEHSLKLTSLVFETKTVGSCFVGKLKWGEEKGRRGAAMAPLAPPVAAPL